ncbi:MAG TPA: flavodoxin domain-containing protein [Cellvibrio sp.]|nr:flavodoxin domain-containing protein [Cellvibrio sp.]
MPESISRYRQMFLTSLIFVRYLAASLLICSYILFCWLCWRNYQRKQNISTSQNIGSSECILIGYASQTGNATRIAKKTAQQLEQAGRSAHLLPLNQITAEHLTTASTALFIVSTYGEGEAPDNGNRFVSRTLASLGQDSLKHLQIGLLGMGDSSYQYFCDFAHHLHNELHHRGAHFLADVIEVDGLDESALRHWQYYLGQISGNTHFSEWSKPAYSDWKLVARECVNPSSPGAPAFHLKLQPVPAGIATDLWQAGDIAEIGPCNSTQIIEDFLQRIGRPKIPHAVLATRDLDVSEEKLAGYKILGDAALVEALPELPQREYSIASVPAEGSLDLLVRQVKINAYKLGTGSGWLTAHAGIDSFIRLRIRTNVHFHSPDATRPLILIGNGTGIAGLRAHIANPARAQARHWLFFGERSAAADNFFHADITGWQRSGLLTRVDTVFSRDAAPGAMRYVQDLLLPNATEIQRWVQEGAVIFVCGSLKGMAQAVDDMLAQILGADQLEALADEHRYCRDVY